MRDQVLEEPIELKVPAQKSMMLVIRLTAAGVIARAGLTVDRLDDVKMAVEEACTCMIEAAQPPKNLKLTFSEWEDGLRIQICGDCACGGATPDEDEINVVRCILESLANGVEIFRSGDQLTGIELRVSPCA